MSRSTLLKQLVLEGPILQVPAVHDALSAVIAERVGFEAIGISGFGVSASMLGQPDIGLLSFGEVLEVTRRICAAVDIPVFADADTGYGGLPNVHRTVRELEACGAAGLNLEDQTWPKRCGHMDDKSVVGFDEAVARVRVARGAARDPDFVLNARTDAIATHGVEEAIRRGNAFLEAGATLVFVEAPTTEEMIQRIVDEIDGPVSVNLVDGGGKTPLLDVARLAELGVRRVSFSVVSTLATAAAVTDALAATRRDGSTRAVRERLMPFERFTELMGLAFYEELEAGAAATPERAQESLSSP